MNTIKDIIDIDIDKELIDNINENNLIIEDSIIDDELEDAPIIQEPKQRLTAEEKDKIARENTKLIHYVIYKLFKNTTIDYDELYSIGMLGYGKALASYDKSKKTKFGTYAFNCIKNEICFYLRRETKIVKNNISLNKELSEDKNGNCLKLEEIISADDINGKSLETMISDKENKEILIKALKNLTKDEQFIIIRRFGLDRGITLTQKQIADYIHMSQANVSKIEKNCIKKLRLLLRKDILENI